MLAAIDQVSGKHFDVVVVGGGTAGLVLATRLSEDPERSVLVLEAGPANLDDPALLMPAAYGSQFGNPQYDWSFTTIPQESCAGRAMSWNRGKTLGGSSAINFYQYHIPSKIDLDAFEELGNPGWNWDALKKFFSRSETFVEPAEKQPFAAYETIHHGGDGPLTIAYPVVWSNLEAPYQEALKSVGISLNKEPFSGSTRGTWITPTTVDPTKLVRAYSANKYYQPAASRPNLTVLTDAHVAAVVLAPKDGQGLVAATGVRFLHGGTSHVVHASKEVVLAAGAIMSPQILELSGIGSPEVLKRANIDVQIDLPGVGENLQEHVYSGNSYTLKEDRTEEFSTFDVLMDPANIPAQIELMKEGKGAFGMTAAGMTFAPLPLLAPSTAPALQKALIARIQAGIKDGKYTGGVKKQYEIMVRNIERGECTCEVTYGQGFGTTPNPPVAGRKHVSLNSMVNHPFTRGSIHVKSNDPLEQPLIDPRYFEEEYDLKSFIELVKFNRALVKKEPLNSIIDAEINPGPEVKTDEDIASYLKNNCISTWHSIGTCSMLPHADGGVVDSKLKVYGTSNLRVVDVSVIPLHIGAHIQATAYALGEIGADIVKGKF